MNSVQGLQAYIFDDPLRGTDHLAVLELMLGEIYLWDRHIASVGDSGDGISGVSGGGCHDGGGR